MSAVSFHPTASEAPDRIRPLLPTDQEAFATLCARDPMRFLTARLNAEVYGFDGQALRAWGAFAADNRALLGVLMRFSNTAVAMDLDGSCGTLFANVLDAERNLAGVRGTSATIQVVRQALRRYTPSDWEDSLCLRLLRPPQCSPERLALARRAESSDLDKLAAFYSGAGLMYRSRANVAAKLERDRVFIAEERSLGRRPERIVSCALLNIEGGDAGIIGGVYTRPDARGKGYASACVAALSLDLQRDGKLPCLYYENVVAGRVYERLGFEEAGQWAILYLKPNRRPEYK